MIIPIDIAMQHLYADPDDQMQVEHKLAAAIEAAEQYMGRRIFADADALISAMETAKQQMVAINTAKMPTDPALAAMQAEINAEALADIKRTLRGVIVNKSIEVGVLLILGDLYANRENSTPSGTYSEMPMGAQWHLGRFRVMGV